MFVKKKQVIIGALLLAFSLITITPLQGWAMAAGESGTAVITEKSPPVGELSATDILSKSKIIAHGMGVAPGQEAGSTPLNCLEGFEAQYAAGVRVFEVDLRLTRDGKVVLRHDWWHSDWQEGISWTLIPTREDFVSKSILGKYTPLSFQDLLRLMERYPDICIITDTKFTDSDVFSIQFDSMMEDARELGLTYLFGRIVIQFYSENMCVALNNIYAYPHYIYTLIWRALIALRRCSGRKQPTVPVLASRPLPWMRAGGETPSLLLLMSTALRYIFIQLTTRTRPKSSLMPAWTEYILTA